MTPEKKTFGYQINVDVVPYRPDTVEYFFGKDSSYIPDYTEDTFGRDIIHSMVKDAITYVLQAKLEFYSQNKIQDDTQLNENQKEFLKYLDEKFEMYSSMENSITSLGLVDTTTKAVVP